MPLQPGRSLTASIRWPKVPLGETDPPSTRDQGRWKSLSGYTELLILYSTSQGHDWQAES